MMKNVELRPETMELDKRDVAAVMASCTGTDPGPDPKWAPDEWPPDPPRDPPPTNPEVSVMSGTPSTRA